MVKCYCFVWTTFLKLILSWLFYADDSALYVSVFDALQIVELLLNAETKYLHSLIISQSFFFSYSNTWHWSLVICFVLFQGEVSVSPCTKHLFLLVWKLKQYLQSSNISHYEQTICCYFKFPRLEINVCDCGFWSTLVTLPCFHHMFLSHLFSYVTVICHTVHFYSFTSAVTPTLGTPPDTDHPGLLPHRKCFLGSFFLFLTVACGLGEGSACICLLFQFHGLFCCTESKKVNYEMIYSHGNIYGMILTLFTSHQLLHCDIDHFTSICLQAGSWFIAI